MANTGAISASSGTNISVGGVPWADPGNALASDDARATAALATTGGNAKTNLLTLLFSGLSVIPAGATIDGIVLEVEKSVTSTSGNPVDATIQLSKDGTLSGLVGTNLSSGKEDAVTVWPTTDAYVTYGSSTDKWGFSSITQADLVAATFSAFVGAIKTTGETSTTVRVDHVRITVYYTAAAGSASQSKQALSIPMALMAM